MTQVKKLTHKAPRGKQRIHLMVVIGKDLGTRVHVLPSGRSMSAGQAANWALRQTSRRNDEQLDVHHVELLVPKAQGATIKTSVRRNSKPVATARARKVDGSYVVQDRGAYPIRDYP